MLRTALRNLIAYRSRLLMTGFSVFLGAVFVTGTLTFSDSVAAGDEASQLRTVLLVFAGIAVFTSSSLIANTFTMLVSQRTQEIGLLRAVGATSDQVARGIRWEATLTGLAGTAAGIPVGVALAFAVRKTFAPDLGPGPLVVSGTTLLLAATVGIGVTVLAAWLPIRRATLIPPVAAITLAQTAPCATVRVMRSRWGSVLAVGGIVLVLWGNTSESPLHRLLGLGAGVVSGLLGLVLLTPALTQPVIALLSRLLRRVFGPVGALAALNAARNPRRTTATTSALMIGLALMSAVYGVTASVQDSLTATADRLTRADVKVTAVSGEPFNAQHEHAIASILAQVSGVSASSPVRTGSVGLSGIDNMMLRAVDAAAAPRLYDLAVADGELDSLRAGAIAIPSRDATFYGYRVGDRITVAPAGGAAAQQLTVGAILSGDLLRDSLVSLDTATRLGVTDTVEFLAKAAPGQESGLADRVEAALGEQRGLAVTDREGMVREASGDATGLLSIVTALLGMSLLIAVAGIVNTLVISVAERAREMNLLRAIGLGKAAVRRMIYLESITISVFGALLGTGTGAVIALAVGPLIADSVPGYAPSFPWQFWAVVLVGTVLVGWLAALWPARHATRHAAMTALSR
ncbi:FtsX-like permease family protein [Streptomyces noursei]|uniref:FtsX-like permease family protein n=1 Tax=Streptomyces TaxID=1883 RepID=UPI0035DAEF9A